VIRLIKMHPDHGDKPLSELREKSHFSSPLLQEIFLLRGKVAWLYASEQPFVWRGAFALEILE
jgi:hypothetical protein